MMGRQGAGQAPLFYAFNLEDHIPGDHLLRGINHFMDLSELRRHLDDISFFGSGKTSSLLTRVDGCNPASV